MGFPWEDEGDGSGWFPGAWDPSAMGDLVSEETIEKVVGRKMSLPTLLDLLARYGAGTLSDAELVDLIRIGIHFMRERRGWTLSPKILEYWLVAGGTPDARYAVDVEVFKGGLETLSELCDGDGSAYGVIRRGVEARLKAPAGTHVNPALTKIRGPDARYLNIPSSVSVLAGGGTEVLYKEMGGVHIANQSGSDHYNAIGEFALTSKVTVTSTVSPSGGWDVVLDSWEVWAWDRYDWHSGLSVRIPLNLLENLGVPEEQRDPLKATLAVLGMDTSLLDEIVVGDQTMSKVEAAGAFKDRDGNTVHAGPFWVVGTSTWLLDVAGTSCGRERSFHVDP